MRNRAEDRLKAELRTEDRRGFTFIEILVSVGVLAILLLLSFPVMASIRRAQRKERVKAAITTLGVAIESYQNDFGVFPIADPPLSVLPDVPNRGNRALVHWLKAGEAAHGRSAPYLPSAYYDDTKRLAGDTLRDEWERPYLYFDTSAMKAKTDDDKDFGHPYELLGANTFVRPVAHTTRGYYNFGRFQLWSAGPNQMNDGGPNPRNDDIGNFSVED